MTLLDVLEDEPAPTQSSWKAYKAFFETNRDKFKSTGLTSLSRSTKLAQIEWNENGNRLAATTTDGNLLVYHFDENSSSSQSSSALTLDWQTTKNEAHTGAVNYMAWQPHADIVATTSSDKSIKIWDVRQKKLTTDITTKAANFTLSWSQCANYLFYGDRESVISVVDMRNQQVVSTAEIGDKEGDIEDIYLTTVSNDGRLLFVATGLGYMQVYNIGKDGSLKLRLKYTVHSSLQSCYELRLSHDNKYMVTGGADSLVTMWELDCLTCIYTYDDLPTAIRSLSWSYDDQVVAAMSDNHTIDIFYAPDGTKVYSHQKEQSEVQTNITFHPKQLLLAYAEKSTHERDKDSPIVLRFLAGGQLKT